MTIKEKAKELTDRFMTLVTTWDCYNDRPLHEDDIMADAKKCAIIMVDEIIKALPDNDEQEIADLVVYYQDVKKEIELL